MTLDKSQPYSQVFGELEGLDGARYYQGGRYFGAQGVEIIPSDEPAPSLDLPAHKPAATKIRKQSVIVELASDGEE